MTPPKNLKFLLFDRSEPTEARRELLERITAPEIYTRLTSEMIGPYHRTRYASGNGIGDHLILGLEHSDDRWAVRAGILNRRPLPGEDHAVSIIIPSGVRSLREGYSVDEVLAGWTSPELPGSSRL